MYNLSDPGAEEAIYDRNCFRNFDMDLLADTVPDETTILNFRHLLEEHGLQKEFFNIVERILEDRHLLMKNGTIVDATIIEAPSSTKNEEKKRDPDMSSTKKNGEWHFGMKGSHRRGMRRAARAHGRNSTAKVHDKAKMKELFQGEENAKFGDKGYASATKTSAKRDAQGFSGAFSTKDEGPLVEPKETQSKNVHPFVPRSSIRSRFSNANGDT